MTTKKPRKPKCTICYDKGYFTRGYQVIGAEDFGGEGFASKLKIEKVPCLHKKNQKALPCNCKCHAAYKPFEHKKCCENAFVPKPEKVKPRICEHEEKGINNHLDVRKGTLYDLVVKSVIQYLNTKKPCAECGKKK